MKLAERQARLKVIDDEQNAIERDAELFGGVFSQEQRERYAALNTEASALMATVQRRITSPDSGEPLPDDWQDTPSRSGRLMGIDKQGNEVRVLEPDERFTAEIPAENRPSVGRLIHARMRGNFSGCQKELAAMGENDAFGSDILVPDKMADYIIDLARANSIMIKAGARTVGMDSATLEIARVVSDPTWEVVAENAPIGESNIALGGVLLTATKLATIVRWSQELGRDAPNIASLIEGLLAKSFSVELDRLALNGHTSAHPSGLLTFEDVPETTTVGAVTWDDIIAGMLDIQQSNYEPTAMIMSPETAAALNMLKDTTGQYLTPPAAVAGLRKLISTSVPTDTVVIGDFSKMIFGIRQQLEIDMSEHASVGGESVWQRYQKALRAAWRGDFAIETSLAFHKLTGITHS